MPSHAKSTSTSVRSKKKSTKRSKKTSSPKFEIKRLQRLMPELLWASYLQISGGWVYTQAPEFVRLDAGPRVGALIDLIEASSHKVIVCIPYRHMLEGINGIFERLKVDFDWCMVHGDTKNRDELFNVFQQRTSTMPCWRIPAALAMV